jgi:glycosyl transferase family 25
MMKNPAAPNLQILVISMADQLERRAHAQKELDELGIPWKFIDAIIGKNLPGFPKDYDREKRLKLFGFDMSLGEISCTLSHRLAWQECVSSNQITLVLEDDFHLKPEFSKALKLALSIQDEWDLFRLHSGSFHEVQVVRHMDEFQLIENLKDPGSAAAFLIKPSSAKVLLAHAQKVFMPADDTIERPWLHGLRILAFIPYPVSVDWTPTTTTDRSKPRLSLLTRIIREFNRLPIGIRRSWYRQKRRWFYKNN